MKVIDAAGGQGEYAQKFWKKIAIVCFRPHLTRLSQNGSKFKDEIKFSYNCV